jgi:PHS family inorganic phosphate transporter-like MFS transporter
MPETARYTALVKGDVNEAVDDMAVVLNTDDLHAEVGGANNEKRPLLTFQEFLACKSPNYVAQLVGTSLTWFFLDIAYYSQSLFQSTVFSTVGWLPSSKTLNPLDELYDVGRAQAIVSLASIIPGYWFTVATIECMGRRPIQIMGFTLMTALMALMAGYYDVLTNSVQTDQNNIPTFIAMYCLTFFFANWGPNSTTFIVPAELFPAHYRGTCHGISAASGKLGAIVGAFGFLYSSQPIPFGIGLQQSLGILAATNFCGLIVTLILTPETKGRTLEDLNGYDAREAETDQLLK